MTTAEPSTRTRTRCPHCGGAIGVYCTRLTRDGQHRMRWLRCRQCHWHPRHGKQVVVFSPSASDTTPG
jgi:hypothetical protein